MGISATRSRLFIIGGIWRRGEKRGKFGGAQREKRAIINVINRFDLNRTRVAEGKRVTDMERGERR